MADVRFHHQEPEMKGWLYKWTKAMVRPVKWPSFVLQVRTGPLILKPMNALTRNQAEMAHTCRGTISLVSAVIHTEDSCNFVISNGGTQTFHLRAGSEVERYYTISAHLI